MKNEDHVPEYLSLLDIAAPYTAESLQQHYRDLVQVWHPDRYAHNDRLKGKAEEKLKLINHAYDYLSKNCDEINRAFCGMRRSKRTQRSEPRKPKSSPRTDFSTYMRFASAAMESLNFQEAHQYFSKCLEIDPESHAAWAGKGTAAGRQSTSTESRLAEMCACWKQALEVAPIEQRKSILRDMATSQIEVAYDFALGCRLELDQQLPYAGLGPAEVPEVWMHYLFMWSHILTVLEDTHALAPENCDLMRAIIGICLDLLEGVTYVDCTTLQFNVHPQRALSVTPEYEQILSNKMVLYTKKINVYEPEYVAPKVTRRVGPEVIPPSAGCFIATCACGRPDHPYVLVLRHFRDQMLCRSYCGRRLNAIYIKFGPLMAARINDKPLVKRLLFYWVIRPMASVVERII